MKLKSHLKPNPDKTIPFLIMVSFLIWFLIARTYTTLFPQSVIMVNNVHVHHFAYGIIMLSIIAYIAVSYPLTRAWRLRISVLLGISLATAYDEFAMWLLLEDLHQDRRNFDAILIITLFFLNTIYFPSFWNRWGKRLGKLFNILLLGLPNKIYQKLS